MNMAANWWLLALLVVATRAAFVVQPFSDRVSIAALGNRPLSVNFYLAYDNTTRDALVIDTGFFSSPHASGLDTFAKTQKLSIKNLYLTHPHPDHFEGLQYWDTDAVTFWVPNLEFIAYMKEAEAFFGDKFDYSSLPYKTLKSTTIQLGPREELKADIHTPDAESPYSVMYYHDRSHSLFVGDNIYVKTHLLLNLLTAKKFEVWRAWLAHLSERYPPDRTTIYPGHGTAMSLRRAVTQQLDYMEDFQRQLCKYRGNINSTARYFRFTSKYRAYDAVEFVDLWPQAEQEWKLYYQTVLKYRGRCDDFSKSAAASARNSAFHVYMTLLLVALAAFLF